MGHHGLRCTSLARNYPMDVDVFLLKIVISQFAMCLFLEARAALQTIERSSEMQFW